MKTTRFTALARRGLYTKTFTVKASSWVKCVELVREYVTKEKPDIHPHDVSVCKVNLRDSILLEEPS